MSLMQRGFTRLFFNGQTIELQSPTITARRLRRRLRARRSLVARATCASVLVDSLGICFQEGHGTALIKRRERTETHLVLRTLRMQV
jgi:hypothetical protein